MKVVVESTVQRLMDPESYLSEPTLLEEEIAEEIDGAPIFASEDRRRVNVGWRRRHSLLERLTHGSERISEEIIR